MVELEWPHRHWSVRWIGLTGICAVSAFAQPVAVAPQWQVNFSTTPQGQTMDSIAISADGGAMMVAVMGAGADPKNPKLRVGNRQIPVKLIGHDLVSRLQFFTVEGGEMPRPQKWHGEVGGNANASLRTMEPGGYFVCRTMGWVKQVGGKVLPLALLRVSFSRSVPPPGTAIVDDGGRVVGIVFQGADSGNTGYAIPAEAVHRVRNDLSNGGKLVRGWLGLALRAESQLPQISRVLPDSPAALAGVRVNDVILSIGSRQVADYADAANAFFYLIPGEPVRVKLLRNAEQLDFTITPSKAKE